MKYAIKAALAAIVVLGGGAASAQTLRETLLRQAAIGNGLTPISKLQPSTNPARSAIGAKLFESTLLSLNGDMSCQKCHLDRFASADGLPNAVGVGGKGEGLARLKAGGRIVPRNVFALWGRGGPGFHTFFWDGRVQQTSSGIVSQFGSQAPAKDALTVAAHLPFVEIREMINDDEMVRSKYEKEDVGAANALYATLAGRLKADPKLGPELARAYGVRPDKIEFVHAANAIATFIRDKFRLRQTRFHSFVFNGGKLSPREVQGGVLFYGKGRCAACHSGAYFTDFRFHTVAFPQAGFGRNGFGVDYGRYNVTFDPNDLYRFRTPPLYNVAKTAPYSHSGSVINLEQAIQYHFDPLRFPAPVTMRQSDRIEQFKRLAKAGNEALPPQLTDGEVHDLAAFLGTLSF